jgi:hypothetical protein
MEAVIKFASKALGKRRFPNMNTLVLNLFLVNDGLKDSYLVDCGSLHPFEIRDVIDAIARCRPGGAFRLVVIVLFTDLLVSTKAQLVRKLSFARTGGSFLPYFVHYRGSSPMQLLTEEESARVQEMLAKCLAGLLELIDLAPTAANSAIVTGDTLVANLGFPLFAGFMIGYPCVYSDSGCIDGRESIESLSFVNLTKFSVLGYTSEIADARIIPSSMPIMEFSVPCALLENDLIFTEALEAKMNDIVLRLSTIASQPSNDVYNPMLAVDRIALKREIIVAPSVVL